MIEVTNKITEQLKPIQRYYIAWMVDALGAKYLKTVVDNTFHSTAKYENARVHYFINKVTKKKKLETVEYGALNLHAYIQLK